jgi:hypothetical protein
MTRSAIIVTTRKVGRLERALIAEADDTRISKFGCVELELIVHSENRPATMDGDARVFVAERVSAVVASRMREIISGSRVDDRFSCALRRELRLTAVPHTRIFACVCRASRIDGEGDFASRLSACTCPEGDRSTLWIADPERLKSAVRNALNQLARNVSPNADFGEVTELKAIGGE